MNRTALVIGPAKYTHRGATFFSKEDVTITTEKETFEVNTSVHGKVDERAIEVVCKASVTPEGRVTQAILDVFYLPFANMLLGTSAVGYTTSGLGVITAVNSNTDFPLVCSGADGEKHSLIAAYVSKPPDIILSATKTMLGQAEFTGIRGNNKAWSDADGIYKHESGGEVADATFDPANIFVRPYTGTWSGKTGFTAFETEDGFTVSINPTFKNITTDTNGTLNVVLEKIEVMAKCVPIGPTSAQLTSAFAIQGATVNRGHSLASFGAALTINDGATDVVSISNAALKTGGFRFGATVLRANEVGFVAARTFAAGASQPLFTMELPT